MSLCSSCTCCDASLFGSCLSRAVKRARTRSAKPSYNISWKGAGLVIPIMSNCKCTDCECTYFSDTCEMSVSPFLSLSVPRVHPSVSSLPSLHSLLFPLPHCFSSSLAHSFSFSSFLSFSPLHLLFVITTFLLSSASIFTHLYWCCTWCSFHIRLFFNEQFEHRLEPTTVILVAASLEGLVAARSRHAVDRRWRPAHKGPAPRGLLQRF